MQDARTGGGTSSADPGTQNTGSDGNTIDVSTISEAPSPDPLSRKNSTVVLDHSMSEIPTTEIQVTIIPEYSVALPTSSSIDPPAPLKASSPINSAARVGGASFDIYPQHSAKSNENVFGLHPSNTSNQTPWSSYLEPQTSRVAQDASSKPFEQRWNQPDVLPTTPLQHPVASHGNHFANGSIFSNTQPVNTEPYQSVYQQHQAYYPTNVVTDVDANNGMDVDEVNFIHIHRLSSFLKFSFRCSGLGVPYHRHLRDILPFGR
jgi:hypothetical protein